ncbi:MAG: transposase [Desulfurococcales archaeon]|nr:transposase [Desulfurococcales archaeon]
MNKQLKTPKRTVVLEGWTNRYGRRALREIIEAYKEMLQEMVEYAVEFKASQATLHKLFYHRFREEYPWLPTRVIKGCYRDAVRRAKSFRELKKKGITKTEKPVVKRITITYSDSQDWKLKDGVIEVRTHRGWVKICYRGHKQLHRYLYNGWKLSNELRLKLNGKKVIIYLTFTKNFEVAYNPKNVVAVDVNENNITLAVFRDEKLCEVHRIETGFGKLVISYAERRKRITKGRSTKIRGVKKALKKLREKERKQDIVYKTAKIIEKLAIQNNAVVVVGNVRRGKGKLVEKIRKSSLRHRIHQWSVSTLVEVLNNKLIHIVGVSEAYSSSIDPFTGKRIRNFTPSMIRIAVRGKKRVRVLKIQLRLAKLGNRLVLDRDVVGAINIGLRYFSSDGSPMALGSTEPHEVRVKLMSPYRGLTSFTELKVLKTN